MTKYVATLSMFAAFGIGALTGGALALPLWKWGIAPAQCQNTTGRYVPRSTQGDFQVLDSCTGKLHLVDLVKGSKEKPIGWITIDIVNRVIDMKSTPLSQAQPGS